MTESSPVEPPAELLGVHVGSYKNLHDQWLRWSDGIALFGINGAGKTNFLEALAILLGTDQTLLLAHQRLAAVAPSGLELVAKVSADELPWPPSWALPLATRPDFALQFPVLFRAQRDAAWWHAIGVGAGQTFMAGLGELALPDDVLEYLQSQFNRPVIRYTLTSFTFEVTDRLENGDPSAIRVERRFSRTLMGFSPPEAVTGLADGLPDVFAPMRSALTVPPPGPDGYADMLALPDVTEPPAQLEWLPRGRRSAEVNEHLRSRIEAAVEPVERLAESLASLPVAPGEFDPDGQWWPYEVAAQAASTELSITLGNFDVKPTGNDAEFYIRDTRGSTPSDIGVVGDADALERFSAGERRWVDEALATAARALDRFAARASWQASLLYELDDADVVESLVTVSESVQGLVKSAGFWTGEAKERLLSVLEDQLLVAARDKLAEHDDAFRRSLMQQLTGLASLRPQTVVRVFDEPESHLHPQAQRSIAGALDRLRLRGDNVVLASHSPHFLDLPDWQLVHVQRTPEGTTLSPLVASDLDARKALAGQMGLTRGELLTRVSFLLVVEGEHDRLLLEELYGARLQDAGVAIVRMHGTSNLLATAQMDFVERHLDVPIGVLLDFVRLDRVGDDRIPPDQLHDEEQALRHLRRACRKKRRPMQYFGLRRPDIVAYLNEDAIRADEPTFPGWRTVMREFDAIRQRPSFKPWLQRTFGVDLTRTDRVRKVVERMVRNGYPAVAELTQVVEEVERTAAEGRWPKYPAIGSA
ncbi:AAA family ATPase [Micromonospora sp. U21]|uniref:AAA family ATPase n=1 Tax=Micromonospora sp. U21 TaxID=2824899 RepID=UPI001B399A6A|nr:AAA family ATPase [Micromonospora sp. U21]MBQ0905485.1 ATP-binding protein [Micromonospora sp. U21]